MVPATACSRVHAAARLCRPLLCTSLLAACCGTYAEVPQQAADCVRSVQDRSLGARHHRLLPHGYGVHGVWGVPQEVCGMVFRDATAAGHRTHLAVSSFADIHVLDYITWCVTTYLAVSSFADIQVLDYITPCVTTYLAFFRSTRRSGSSMRRTGFG